MKLCVVRYIRTRIGYCLHIVKQSGKFQLITMADSTPVTSKQPKSDTPTPVRELRQELMFQFEDLPQYACKEPIPSRVNAAESPKYKVSGYAYVPKVYDQAMVKPPDYIPHRLPHPSRAAFYPAEPIPLNPSHVAHFSTPKVPKLPEFDVNCLIRNHVYPDHVILEAIRKSLLGKARTVQFHLREGASVFDRIGGIYGKVAS